MFTLFYIHLFFQIISLEILLLAVLSEGFINFTKVQESIEEKIDARQHGRNDKVLEGARGINQVIEGL